MNTNNAVMLSCAVFSLLCLPACGGGGGGSAVTPGTQQQVNSTYPLQQAYASLKSKGYQQTVNVAGTASVNGTAVQVTGSLVISEAPVNSVTTFDGQPAQEESTSVTGNVNVLGTNVSVADTTNDFLSPGGQPLGETSSNSYCVTTSYTALPTSISIGATGPYSTFVCYTDSTMTTMLGSATSTYAITAGATSSTATLSIIVSAYNAEGTPVSNSTTKFQMDSAGNITFSAISVTATIDGVTVTYSS